MTPKHKVGSVRVDAIKSAPVSKSLEHCIKASVSLMCKAGME